MGCQHGDILELEIVEANLIHSNESYKLSGIGIKQSKFKSVKSQIRRDKKLADIKKRKAAKRLMKTEKLAQLRRDNPDIRIDEDAFLGNCLASHIKPDWMTKFCLLKEDSDSDEEIEPLYTPKIGNPILWIKYTPASTIWMAVAEYDCGYVYEYDFSKSEPLHCIELKRATEMEANSFLQM